MFASCFLHARDCLCCSFGVVYIDADLACHKRPMVFIWSNSCPTCVSNVLNLVSAWVLSRRALATCQAGRQAGMQARRQAGGRQASRRTDRQADSQPSIQPASFMVVVIA